MFPWTRNTKYGQTADNGLRSQHADDSYSSQQYTVAGILQLVQSHGAPDSMGKKKPRSRSYGGLSPLGHLLLTELAAVRQISLTNFPKDTPLDTYFSICRWDDKLIAMDPRHQY